MMWKVLFTGQKNGSIGAVYPLTPVTVRADLFDQAVEEGRKYLTEKGYIHLLVVQTTLLKAVRTVQSVAKE